jgi:hypothetical protein
MYYSSASRATCLPVSIALKLKQPYGLRRDDGTVADDIADEWTEEIWNSTERNERFRMLKFWPKSGAVS